MTGSSLIHHAQADRRTDARTVVVQLSAWQPPTKKPRIQGLQGFGRSYDVYLI